MGGAGSLFCAARNLSADDYKMKRRLLTEIFLPLAYSLRKPKKRQGSKHDKREIRVGVGGSGRRRPGLVTGCGFQVPILLARTEPKVQPGIPHRAARLMSDGQAQGGGYPGCPSRLSRPPGEFGKFRFHQTVHGGEKSCDGSSVWARIVGHHP